MFTGIIEATGALLERKDNIFTFENPFEEIFALGDSVSLSGMCATVISGSVDVFSVEIIAESRRLTLFEAMKVGTRVNLERAARMNARNSGHNVTGHIDARLLVKNIEKNGDYWEITVDLPAKWADLVVQKGSVAIDGVSLTISSRKQAENNKKILTNASKNEKIDKREEKEKKNGEKNAKTGNYTFSVCIIDHTWRETTLSGKKVGDLAQIEFDIVGKYIMQALKPRLDAL